MLCGHLVTGDGLGGFSVSDPSNLPLAGIVVLDFGQVFQGPYATLLMAKAGADVIKIEPPQGEPLRRRALPGKSTTFPIAMLNSNKRAITLNLKHERGRALLFEMAGRADVLLENFSSGTMDRLGVGWAELRQVNPRLVYASGSGDGLSGPDRDNLAMDLTIQAVSGLISTTGFPDGPPVKAEPAVVDFLSGIHLYAAVTTALFERERTGKGRLVEVAMQEAAYATLTSHLEAYWQSGSVPPRTPATAAMRARRSASIRPMTAMSRSTSRSRSIGIICWPRWAAKTCATTRVSRPMPTASHISTRPTLSSAGGQRP